jgi:phosphohistidine phosphatase
MKTIFIGRHAKSSWADLLMSDFERPLNERGKHDAPIMAHRLKEMGFSPQCIISSPANRALSTAKYYAKTFDLPVHTKANLYHGVPENYIEALQEADDTFDSVILFGHNPTLTMIANEIQYNCIDNIPTSGVIIATSDKNKWSDVEWKNCKLIKIIYPKET